MVREMQEEDYAPPFHSIVGSLNPWTKESCAFSCWLAAAYLVGWVWVSCYMCNPIKFIDAHMCASVKVLDHKHLHNTSRVDML